MREYIFRPADRNEAEQILFLYQSAIGAPFCVWNEEYPTEREIENDLSAQTLYVLTAGPEIVGALSVVPENELDGLPGWVYTDASVREIARVVVKENHRGRHLAEKMVSKILCLLRNQKCSAVHLSVVKSNLPAYITYQKLGFCTVSSAQLYGGEYWLMEKAL